MSNTDLNNNVKGSKIINVTNNNLNNENEKREKNLKKIIINMLIKILFWTIVEEKDSSFGIIFCIKFAVERKIAN